MNVEIRKANENDVEGIGFVHYTAWIETYTGMIPEVYLAKQSVERSVSIFKRIGCKNIVVATVDGNVIGFCGWGDFRDETNNMGEIQGIYILDKYKRMGVGKKLLDFALSDLEQSGYKKIGLWVLEENINAILFYEKQGFEYTGVKKEEDLGEIVTERLYVKEI